MRRAGSDPGAGYEASSPGRPVFGPARLADAWAYLEWRVTEDILDSATDGAVFLHAAGAVLAGRLVLLVGGSGAGKSTLLAHLMLRGHSVLGDDVVRFATDEGRFSAVGRSVKLDDKALRSLPLVAALCAAGAIGTLLAAGCYYVSPATIRRSWQAEPARPWGVVLLDSASHTGASGVAAASEGAAAVSLARNVLGGTGLSVPAREAVTVRLLESLADAAGYRAVGGDPALVAEALEREVTR